jgi:hypothetical protein
VLQAVILTPASASIGTGGTQQFSVSGQWSNGATTAPAVTYSATGGTVTSGGLYTAGSTAGTFRVIAVQQGGTLADTSTVTLSAAPPVLQAVILTPSSASIVTGGTQQFSVSGQWSNGATTAPAVTYSASGGTISTGGLYTAGSTAGSFRVIAVHQGGTLADTSAITLTAPVLQAVILTPSSASVTTGGTRQFSVSGQWSNGATTAPAVTYSATGGTISTGGLYTAGGTAGTFRVIAVQQGGPLADTSTVTLSTAPPPGSNHMYFNSAEAGCGTDSSVLLCDDFEDGDWYTKDCDQANASGGLLQTDGWCGTIYANPITPAGAAVCGGVGVGGTNCAATHGMRNGGQGGRNKAEHELSQSVTELYARFYTKPSAGYLFGTEKVLAFNMENGDGIKWGNLHFNCGAGSASPSGDLQFQGTPPETRGCQTALEFQGNRWYFVEVHIKLSSPGAAPDGTLEIWVNDCGTSGTGCTGTPTRRLSITNWRYARNSASELLGSLWWEDWGNPASTGDRLIDQIKVSKVGPIGFM